VGQPAQDLGDLLGDGALQVLQEAELALGEARGVVVEAVEKPGSTASGGAPAGAAGAPGTPVRGSGAAVALGTGRVTSGGMPAPLPPLPPLP